ACNAALSGSSRAWIEISLGRPSRSALSVISSLDASSTTPASAGIVSSGGVHSAWSEAATPPAALPWPPPPPPPGPACAPPSHAAAAFAETWASTVHAAGLYLIVSLAPALRVTLRLFL